MWRVLIVVAACGSSHGAVDARTDPAVCKANREAALDRTCTVAADCVLVASEDCCGTIDLAVRAGTQSGFASVEAAYVACLACPPLGCAHQDEAEDGTAPSGTQAIVAICDTGHCKAVVQ
jgi:hypothetical protein